MSVAEYPLTQAGANRLAKALYTALRDRAVELPDDAETVSELQTARLVETGPGTVKLVNPPGTHDDIATVVGMCLVALGEAGGGPGSIWVPTAVQSPRVGDAAWAGARRGR